ncbi:5'/3'-nucleotidase SurE [Actinoplanes sp. NBRC 14428]|uniref:5'-nucleotidase SurE n=1 Tax=Pseudosporangium ferrugineum TaxID=439699 RepID=A0A2T0RE63_9ACTN|nr:5'/3'-nucleotidase SurE [Pseudosporangium ferrugineum]PRY19484.1 5'-nucleotidase [Pseudosporangium ferrugineum]BCJ51316.1 5'/3'-nucleotidase SurE [Actinoplanes sp. NBRC 14428]
MTPRILITNDDGIDAPGLRWLARAARRQGFDVVVAAPLTEASGTSAAMTAVEKNGKIHVQPRELPGVKNVPAYAVAASPAFIVLLAIRGAFGAPPDLVLSGINRGANAGAAVVHSGTVGATLTASHAGLHGLAVSLDVLSPANGTAASGGQAIADLDKTDDEQRHWTSAADLAVKLLPTLTHTPPGTILNLNVPDLHVDGIRGLRRARLARFGQVQMSIAEAGEGFVRTAVQAADEPLEPGTDLAALAEGYAVVTPIRAPGEATDVKINLENIVVQTPAF